MARLTINNATGSVSGSTLTINSGATLTVSSTTVVVVTLNGGNIVNNGNLNVTSTPTGASAGITCATPTQAPSSATEYGYSGSGNLNINVSSATAANSSGFFISSLGANATYKLLFNGVTTTFNQANTLASYAIRAGGGLAASPVIIGGAGFTLSAKGGLLSLGSQSTVTINAETTFTLNSIATNVTRGIASFSGSANATTFTNKGTINILGTSTQGGLFFSTGTGGAVVSFNIANEGTINVDMNISTVGQAPLATGNGGGAGAAGTAVNIKNTGTLNLKNTATANGTGFSIFGSNAGEAPPMIITNNGTLYLEGTISSFGSKTTINNNGSINLNSEFRSFTAINNNIGGIINFVRTAATATTRQIVFDGLLTSDLSGAVGSTYTGGGNTYSVINQKYASGTTLTATVVSSASIPSSGTLTLASGTGTGTATTTINYTSVSIPALNGALPSTTTNSGTINTDTASNLNIISGVTTNSNSIIAPGGSSGKGIVDFSNAAMTISGKFNLQVSGSATAGIDYDQITNSAIGGSLSIGGTLDVTGIYTPAGPVTIDIVTTEATGTLAGTFGSVIGITTGWSVDYSASGKVQLVYLATAPTMTTWTGGTSSGWNTESNWSNGVPDQNSDVTITSGTFQPSPYVNVNIQSLIIDSGATLEVNPGFNLTVKEAITNNGTLTIKNNANLIQVDNIANTGAITLNRNSNALSRLDYTIWSSPVESQNLLAFSPATLTTRFYNYNETTNLYNAVASPSTTNFADATGYLIRIADDHPTTPTLWNVSFSGVPNNGDVSKAVTYNGASFGYNMVGNPYPSTIDAELFLAANSANIERSLYFWRKINGALGSAYAVYNPMGGTAATPSSAVPNGIIQVGQGFFVKAKSASSVNFTNAMRVANNANQFFKTKQKTKDRVWLNLTNTTGAFSQALVGYTADAIVGVDMYDAKYINDCQVDLTSNINNEEYTIQGRAAFDASDVVALNFKTNVAGDYSIALDHYDGLFSTG
jgi:hypothetical protein